MKIQFERVSNPNYSINSENYSDISKNNILYI